MKNRIIMKMLTPTPHTYSPHLLHAPTPHTCSPAHSYTTPNLIFVQLVLKADEFDPQTHIRWFVDETSIVVDGGVAKKGRNDLESGVGTSLLTILLHNAYDREERT